MHLVDDETILRVQNNLMHSKNIRSLHGSWWFNIAMFILIVGIMIFFLRVQYTNTSQVLKAEATRKDISFQPLMWNNAVRNNIDM
jgi:hypothetical protein